MLHRDMPLSIKSSNKISFLFESLYRKSVKKSASSIKRMEMLQITNKILLASVLVGITTSYIIFCSHSHQEPIYPKFSFYDAPPLVTSLLCEGNEGSVLSGYAYFAHDRYIIYR